jgi:hypothetical protein
MFLPTMYGDFGDGLGLSSLSRFLINFPPWEGVVAAQMKGKRRKGLKS